MNTLLDKAYGCIAAAKRNHDTLEDYYINAMDFDKVDELYHQMFNEILSLRD